MADDPDPSQRDQLARELYEEYVAEDAAGLEAAYVLERVDITALPGSSTPLTDAQKAVLEVAIEQHARRPKPEFLPVRDGGVASLSRCASRGRP